jgi:hypothetical protein
MGIVGGLLDGEVIFEVQLCAEGWMVRMQL